MLDPDPETSALTRALKEKARQLGFSLVGVTSPQPPPHLDKFKGWIEKERHGEMAYLSSERSLERRADPCKILPGCKSILVLGIPYPSSPEYNSDSQAGSGLVASYAWGSDYHEVLPGRLQALVDFLEMQTGSTVPNRWYTDTGPVLERDLAQRAGLGWIGKNTCLIQPQMGSYFLLAEVLLGINLVYDSPFVTDHCGTCSRCLEACPTECILPDRTIDARMCISYLTIELKGTIPFDLRPKIGDWVFGCDICQQVCPWNQRFSLAVGDLSFEPQGGQDKPNLEEALSLSPQAFNQRFKGTPIKRAKRRGYLRNVCVVLGNQAERSSIPALSQTLLNEFEPLVRAHAAWALGRIGTDRAHRALDTALQTESDESVRQEIRLALGQEIR